MGLIVQKFGGTSVGTPERILSVAMRVFKEIKKGNQIALVVSAMAGDTDRLISLAAKINKNPDPREMDVLLSSGEQVSIALLSMALQSFGLESKSFLAFQLPILTTQKHTKARILKFETQCIQEAISSGIIPVLAGFQGLSEEKNITTLGRGGSDTTAIALAHELGAKECHIYTDVKGVYTADPRIVKDAIKVHQIDMEEMLELSSSGAKVMQVRAMEMAYKLKMPIRILSSFEKDDQGTIIDFFEDESMEAPLVKAVVSKVNESAFVLQKLSLSSNIFDDIFGILSELSIVVDVISYTPIFEKEEAALGFTIEGNDFEVAKATLEQYAKEKKLILFSHKDIAKVSIVGVGMRSHPGVAHQAFHELARLNIPLLFVGTSEIKISFVLNEEYMELATRALHQIFQLNQNS